MYKGKIDEPIEQFISLTQRKTYYSLQSQEYFENLFLIDSCNSQSYFHSDGTLGLQIRIDFILLMQYYINYC